MSRGGYEKAENDLMEAKRKKLEQTQSDSAITSAPSPIRRENMWIYAHKKRSGSYSSEHARVIGENIVSKPMN